MTTGQNTLRKMIALAAADDASVFARSADLLELALGKCARALFDIEANIIDGDNGQSGVTDFLAATPDPGLLYVISPPGGCAGLIWLDAVLVNALIELETRAPDDSVLRLARKPTLIDATLCGEFITHLLAAFSVEADKSVGHAVMPLHKIVRHETDARQLAFALERTEFHWIGGTMQFQGGIRGGRFQLALTQKTWAHGRSAAIPARDPVWDRCLAENLLGAAYKMQAVLETIELPLGRAMTLAVGDMLPISAAALSELRLVAPNNSVMFEGCLGQIKARKAIWLTGSPMSKGFGTPAPVPVALPTADGQ